MSYQINALNSLLKLQQLSKDIEVDSDTFATIILYALTVAAQAIEDMPPAVQASFKHTMVQHLDEVTRDAGEKENRAAWILLEGLGLADLPGSESYRQHLRKHAN